MPPRPLPAPPADLWDKPEMADALARRDMTAVLVIYRRWTGATQPQIARAVGISQSYISEIVNGKRQVTALDMFERLVDGLGIPPERVGLAPRPASSDPSRRTVVVAGSAAALVALDDEIEETVRRLQRLTASNVDEATLGQVGQMVETVGRTYEASDAVTAYPAALRQRRWVDELMDGRQRPRERAALYTLSGKLSGLLGYLAFDAGNRRLAAAYCDEALTLAQAAGNRDLTAWVRGTQSFIAYYTGSYHQALDLARDGQRYARGGPQSIRLAISGEARALGKLGDRAGVDDAVDRALTAHANIKEGDPVGYFLSFEPYSAARIAGNAASAYLAVGALDKVREQADVAIPVFAAHRSAASHALTLVDVSMSYLAGASPEPERAGQLVSQALTVGARLRSEVVTKRAGDFLTSADRWRDVPAIAAVADAVQTWQPATA